MSTGAVGKQHRVGAVEVDRRREVANRVVVPPFLEGGVALGLESLSHVLSRPQVRRTTPTDGYTPRCRAVAFPLSIAADRAQKETPMFSPDI